MTNARGPWFIMTLWMFGCSERAVVDDWNAFVDDHDHCEVDADCTLVFPGCPLGCYTSIRADAAAQADDYADRLIRRYERGGMSCVYSCVQPSEPFCNAGVCDVDEAIYPPAENGEDASTEPPLTSGAQTTSENTTITSSTVTSMTTDEQTSTSGATAMTSDSGTSRGEEATTMAPGDASTTAIDETSATSGGSACRDDHRVVAFVANWEACPTAEQLAAYSHVVVAFAVTYTWTETGNLCDPECAIQPVEGCTGVGLSELVADLHAQGKEVLLSFGGAGMGGVWEGTCGEMTKCWDACLDRTGELAAELTDLVATHDLDGIDIDYEYCLNSPAYRDFLEGLTLELRERLDSAFPGEAKRITHAPMDREVDAGETYFEILTRTQGAIDFIMPQYYNGGDSPFTQEGLARIETHYATLVAEIFAGDASRVTVGFCIEPGCQPVATQPAALDVIRRFDAVYPDHGGMFFWAHPDDAGAAFSAPFRAYYDETACE